MGHPKNLKQQTNSVHVSYNVAEEQPTKQQ